MTDFQKKYISFKIPKSTLLFFFIILFCLGTLLLSYKREVQKLRKTRRIHDKYVALCETKTGNTKPIVGGISIPKSLENIPLLDREGVVISTKTLSIRDVEAPYNGSIESYQDGYRLFFRYDKIVHGTDAPYQTFIGCCDLNKDFNQTEKEFVLIDTKSKYSEDPRIINVNKKQFLVYNDLLLPNKQEGILSFFKFKKIDLCVPRTMHIAELDKDLQPKYTTNLDIQLEWVEKNWTPFEYTDEANNTNIYFEYHRSPHKILKLEDPTINQITHMNYTNAPPFQNLYWPKEWGSPRGGTPAKLVDDQYLAFFHSGFKDDDGFVWYVMGAYTFENKPPFKITSISNAPILFDGIFSSPHLNTSNPWVRAIYPAGFVVENKDGKDIIHVSCGENDSAVKIITLDKEKLLKSLKKL